MGLACAARFAAEGANLALFDIEADTVQAAAAGLQADGHGVESVTGDVSVAADVERAVSAAVSRFGGLDVLVHTAGIVELKPILQFDERSWRRIVDVNLTGVFLTTRAAGRVMAQRSGGASVVFASTNAVFPEEANAPCSAAKGGIVRVVRNCGTER